MIKNKCEENDHDWISIPLDDGYTCRRCGEERIKDYQLIETHIIGTDGNA